MPELPEVETIVRGLQTRVAGDRIQSVWIGSRKQPLKSSAKKIAATLTDKQIIRVHRMGKHIVFDLQNEAATDSQWIVHLGMTGRMLICDPEAESIKHTHLLATLASGRELRFIDARMFGKLHVVTPATFDPGGKEPLDIDPTTFVKLFRNRKTPIKSALLNQKLLRGVGNIYADEALSRTGIRPQRKAANISKPDLEHLLTSIQAVLKEAIALGGSSVSDYVGADGEEGFFQLQHRVYGREGEPCLTCKSPIRRLVIGGRSSHYCPKCQK